MRDLFWRTGLTVAALAALAILEANLSCGVGNRLVEQVLGQTPQSRIGSYLDAIARGDRQAALDLWSQWNFPSGDLQARREAVTNDLLARGPRLEYRILQVEWWRTCCEPAVIDDPAQAGGARVRVAVSGADHPVRIYRFDLVVPGGYWGDAAGNPVRRWILVDIYPDEEVPLAWPRW
jgi:hypothetical protein